MIVFSTQPEFSPSYTMYEIKMASENITIFKDVQHNPNTISVVFANAA